MLACEICKERILEIYIKFLKKKLYNALSSMHACRLGQNMAQDIILLLILRLGCKSLILKQKITFVIGN